jgi:CBS domain-containing protein
LADVMSLDPVVAAPGDISVEEFLRRRLARHPTDAIPVLHEGEIIGAAGLEEARRLPRRQWATTRLAEIATPLKELATVGPLTDAADALERLQQKNARRLFVVSGGRLAGVLTLGDLLAQMELQAALSRAA